MIDPILIGDNPFVGVDHLSQDSGRVKAERFKQAEKVVEILKFSSELGIKGFVASTHPNLRGVVEYILKNTDLSTKLSVYPILPYAQGYVMRMTEMGIAGAINDIIKPARMQEKLSIIMKGGIDILTKDVKGIAKSFIDVELLSVKKMNVKAVFLHDVVTDLALALKSKEAFEIFMNHIKDKYNVMPGFVTKNFVMLVKQVDEWNLEMPLIMTSFNKVGFQMNPSREECERCLKDYKVDVIAMSTLAAGYLKPEGAYDYLFKLPNIKSVVVGVSTKQHALETFNILKQHFVDIDQ